MKKILIFILIIASNFTISSFTPGSGETEKMEYAIKEFKIDSVFRGLVNANKFNGCVLVAQHNKILYKNAFGYANPVLGERLNENSVFQLASVSKTITGIAMCQLYEQNKFLLDDPFVYYFPEFPYHTVTIRDLMSHMSGLPDYLEMNTNAYVQGGQYLCNQDVHDALKYAGLPLRFSPGSKYQYNNTNYALLALMVEKLSGQTFKEYVKQNIFGPLEMVNSFIALPEEVWVKENRTFGFNKKYKINENDRYDGVFGDKGAYSTIIDMYKFDRALYPGVLLRESTLDLAFTNNLIKVSSKKQYGLGFRIREDKNHDRIIYHNGWWHGYRTAFHRRESDNSCVIILSNRLDRVVYTKAKELFGILDYHVDSVYANN